MFVKKSVFAAMCISCFLFATTNAISAERQERGIKKVILNEDPWPPYTLGTEGREPVGGIVVDVIPFNKMIVINQNTNNIIISKL